MSSSSEVRTTSACAQHSPPPPLHAFSGTRFRQKFILLSTTMWTIHKCTQTGRRAMSPLTVKHISFSTVSAMTNSRSSLNSLQSEAIFKVQAEQKLPAVFPLGSVHTSGKGGKKARNNKKHNGQLCSKRHVPLISSIA